MKLEPDRLSVFDCSFPTHRTRRSGSGSSSRPKGETTLLLATEATDLGTFDYYPQAEHLDQARRHFGLPPGAPASYEIFITGLHPDDRERVQSVLRKALSKGSDGIYGAEYRTACAETRSGKRNASSCKGAGTSFRRCS